MTPKIMGKTIISQTMARKITRNRYQRENSDQKMEIGRPRVEIGCPRVVPGAPDTEGQESGYSSAQLPAG